MGSVGGGRGRDIVGGWVLRWLGLLGGGRTSPRLWCRASPGPAWSAVCFRVRPGFRRRGLMHDLLEGAVEHARASGALVIEGYPVDPEGDRVEQTAAYVGTVGLFEEHGFERVLQTAGRSGGKRRWLVRRRMPGGH